MRRHEQRLGVGYFRVSTAEQGQSGLGLEAQRASVHGFVASQGWTLVAEFEDVASGKDDRQPGFQTALARCRQLGAALVAARLDRITCRAHTLSQLLEYGVSIWAADMLGADDLIMRVHAAIAQKQRELIGAPAAPTCAITQLTASFQISQHNDSPRELTLLTAYAAVPSASEAASASVRSRVGSSCRRLA